MIPSATRRSLNFLMFACLCVPLVQGQTPSSEKKFSIAEMRKQAEGGNAAAQSNLGWMYDKGEGVPKDAVQAVAWYRKAAEQGLAFAQSNLGWMYDTGEGVPKDAVQAYMWWNLAASRGDEDAKKNRDIVEATMTPAQIDEAQKLSREWKPKKEVIQ